LKKYKVTIYLVALAFMLMIINTATAQTTDRKVDWEIVSENLVNAIQSDNPGLQQSAMRLVIQYADHVDVEDAVFNMMRLYRYSEDSKVRQLALVTLHKIGDEYAMDFVRRNIEYETDKKIIKLSNACLNDHNTLAPVAEGQELAAK
jgi:hypothetical protein